MVHPGDNNIAKSHLCKGQPQCGHLALQFLNLSYEMAQFTFQIFQFCCLVFPELLRARIKKTKKKRRGEESKRYSLKTVLEFSVQTFYSYSCLCSLCKKLILCNWAPYFSFGHKLPKRKLGFIGQQAIKRLRK